MSHTRAQKAVLIDFSAEGYGLYPFGLYALRAYALQRVPDITIEIVAIRATDDVDLIITDIAQRSPDVIGFTCFVWSENQVHAASRRLRGMLPDAFIVLGGPQIEIGDPLLSASMTSGVVDAAVCGEGEQPFAAILQALVSRRPVLLEDIPGVSIVKGDTVKWSAPRSYGKAFEESTNPVIDDEELLQVARRTGVFVYETARGCPYQCTFCDQGVKTFRSRPMSQIVADLQRIIAQRPRKILFLDSTFNVSPARTRQLLTPIIESGIDVEIEGEVKPERCDLETIQLMRAAGFKNIEVGLQSVKAGTLQFIKRNNDFRRIEQSITWLLEAGIEVHVDTIIGLPGETLADWLETINYCFSLGNVVIFSNTLKILPNSELKHQVVGLGFKHLREKNCAVIKTDAMTLDDINMAKLHQKMIKHYWNRAEDKAALRQIIMKHYRGRLTLFTGDAMAALSAGHPEADLKTTKFWMTRHRNDDTVATFR